MSMTKNHSRVQLGSIHCQPHAERLILPTLTFYPTSFPDCCMPRRFASGWRTGPFQFATRWSMRCRTRSAFQLSMCSAFCIGICNPRMFSSQMFSLLVVDLDAFLNGAKELGRLDMYHATRPKGIPQGSETLRVCQRTQQSDE